MKCILSGKFHVGNNFEPLKVSFSLGPNVGNNNIAFDFCETFNLFCVLELGILPNLFIN
jgi:hypothetical protein